MTNEWGFTIGVVFFVILLILAYRAGRKGKRTAHIALALAAVTTLIGLIYGVEKLVHGRLYDVAVFRTHMVFVGITLAALVVLVGLGLGLLKAPSWRSLHRSVAICFICSLGPTVGTGLWLYSTVHDRAPDQIPAGQSARRESVILGP